MGKRPEFINGICVQLLFSPKGGIEGALVKQKGSILQASIHPNYGDALVRATTPGKRLRVLAIADHSPKTREGVHPVYQFESFADSAGAAIESDEATDGEATIECVVAALHFARHGQPNGVILKTDEFIHLRPSGMAQVELGVGSKLKATGEVA